MWSFILFSHWEKPGRLLGTGRFINWINFGLPGCKNDLHNTHGMICSYWFTIGKYYLHSKMVIPFLEFEIFWESLFTFLLIQIALWHKLDSSCKKVFTKIMQNDWKVNKLCWLFTQNQCRNNISTREIDTLLFFPLDFILESRISPRRRWGIGQQMIHLWNSKMTKDFLVL